jgi:NAD(P)-dependent dehydrogenase (short-subunit alcohol dehydrogenase family)
MKYKSALVTGGSNRLGKAIAVGLAENGLNVAITYTRSAEKANETVAYIRTLGRESIAIKVDFEQNPADMKPIIENVIDTFGNLGILVNNAAVFEEGNWDTTTEENWDRHFSINLKAPFFLSQVFAQTVIKGQQGHIINIADWRGVRPGTGHMAYTLTKTALIGLTKSLALALAPEIQVNAIAPGMILPPPGKDIKALEHMASKIPAARIGSPEEIVNAVIYLVRSDFVSGELIYVTGGEHL